MFVIRSLFRALSFSLALLASTALSASASAVDMGIVTGGSSGTYIKIGRDIAELVAREGVELKVYPSNGSLDNVADVYERPGVQMGIVQSDVLAFIKAGKNDTAKLGRIAEKIKMVFPLYNEEVHVVASNTVESLDDLRGKRVAVGKDGSGTALTSVLVLDLAGVEPGERVSSGGQEALSKLLAGEVDAMFYVGGYPLSLFETVAEEKLRLVPIMDKSIVEHYPSSRIPGGTYPFQAEAVDTVAVKAVLMSYDYKRANCANVGKVARAIHDNYSWLREHGHSKWQVVDLDFDLQKWDRYSCVQQALRKDSARTQQDDKARGAAHPESGTKTLLRSILKEL